MWPRMELAGWVGLGAVLWAGLGSTAPLAAPADHVRQAIEEMAGGDFAAANASLDDATREVLSTAAVVSGSALAEIHYYRGILIYYSGGDRDAALAEWWRALEKVDALAWDVGLVADPDAQALFEELRQDVRKLRSLGRWRCRTPRLGTGSWRSACSKTSGPRMTPALWPS